MQQSLRHHGSLAVRGEDERPPGSASRVECVEGSPDIVVRQIDRPVPFRGGMSERRAIGLPIPRCVHRATAVERGGLYSRRNAIGGLVERCVVGRSVPATADIGRRVDVEDVHRGVELINRGSAGRRAIRGVFALRERAPVQGARVVRCGRRRFGIEWNTRSHRETNQRTEVQCDEQSRRDDSEPDPANEPHRFLPPAHRGTSAPLLRRWYQSTVLPEPAYALARAPAAGSTRTRKDLRPRMAKCSRASQCWPGTRESRRSGVSSSSSTTLASSRARGAPRQKWMPWPNATCPATLRVTSKRSGSWNLRGSRLAEPKSNRTLAPAGMRVPATTTSCVVFRKSACAAES